MRRRTRRGGRRGWLRREVPMDRSETHRCITLVLPAELHAKFKAYAKSQNRSMRQQLEIIIQNAVNPNPLAPVIKMSPPASPLAAKTVVTPTLTESDVRRIVRHELS